MKQKTFDLQNEFVEPHNIVECSINIILNYLKKDKKQRILQFKPIWLLKLPGPTSPLSNVILLELFVHQFPSGVPIYHLPYIFFLGEPLLRVYSFLHQRSVQQKLVFSFHKIRENISLHPHPLSICQLRFLCPPTPHPQFRHITAPPCTNKLLYRTFKH